MLPWTSADLAEDHLGDALLFFVRDDGPVVDHGLPLLRM
jgi:hypothetical protein